MDNFNSIIKECLKEDENRKNNKAIASALRYIVKNEFKYDSKFKHNNNIFEHLEKNFLKWQKDPDSMSVNFQMSFKIYEVIKFLEKCSK